MPDRSGADLRGLLGRWRDELASWAIPEQITAAVAESPWVLPRQVFARRADWVVVRPAGPSFEIAWAALDPPGGVLDVGAGAGAAGLPLLPRATSLTVVDSDTMMLGLLAERAAQAGRAGQADSSARPPGPGATVRTVAGRWPDVAAEAGTADVVTCHHVLYNVPDLLPFLEALTGHARRLVVAEITAVHPLVSLNELWLRFHGLHRPAGPTADDLAAILSAMGLQSGREDWRRPGSADYATFAELVEVTRRRLCLPPERAGDLADALVELGTDPARPADLGSSGRDLVTFSWHGTATR